MAKKKKVEGVFVGKKTIIITAILIIVLVLLALYFWKGSDIIKTLKPGEKAAEVKSDIEASERLAGVADDITDLRDELNSISKSFSAP